TFTLHAIHHFNYCLPIFFPLSLFFFFLFFFFNDTATTEIYTLSLHDALPISSCRRCSGRWPTRATGTCSTRSEEHTSELQSRSDLVCRLLLEKKKKKRHARFSMKRKKNKISKNCKQYVR